MLLAQAAGTSATVQGLEQQALIPAVLQAGRREAGVPGLAPAEAAPRRADTASSLCPHVVVPP